MTRYTVGLVGKSEKYISGYSLNIADKKEARTKTLKDLQDPERFQQIIMRDFDIECVYSEEPQKQAFYGIAVVDLEPENDADFDKFGPIFVSGNVDGEPVSLTGVKRAKNLWLTTPYLQCLCSIGMKITKVHCLWEYKAAPCLRTFVDKLIEERKRGDANGNPIQAEVAKLTLNSTYGSLIENLGNREEIRFVEDSWRVCEEMNSPGFKDAFLIGDNLYQISSRKKKIDQNLPIQLGKAILDSAKMKMVNLYCVILERFVDMSKIDLCSMDTDSITIAISEETLDDCVWPSLRKEWEESVRPYWFVHRDCGGKTCSAGDSCNRRTPGPFKQEHSGERLIGLSSKMFTVTSTRDDEQPKIACKGIVKDSLYYDNADQFKNILVDDATNLSVSMSSFQRKGGDMLTLALNRSISNKYAKRAVDSRDVTRTKTLDCTVDCAIPAKKMKIWEDHKKVLREKRKKYLAKFPENCPDDPSPPSHNDDPDDDCINDPQPSTSAANPTQPEEDRSTRNYRIARAKLDAKKQLMVEKQIAMEKERVENAQRERHQECQEKLKQDILHKWWLEDRERENSLGQGPDCRQPPLQSIENSRRLFYGDEMIEALKNYIPPKDKARPVSYFRF